jgi:hypothetical protein
MLEVQVEDQVFFCFGPLSRTADGSDGSICQNEFNQETQRTSGDPQSPFRTYCQWTKIFLLWGPYCLLILPCWEQNLLTYGSLGDSTHMKPFASLPGGPNCCILSFLFVFHSFPICSLNSQSVESYCLKVVSISVCRVSFSLICMSLESRYTPARILSFTTLIISFYTYGVFK